MLYQLSYAPVLRRILAADFGHPRAMTESDEGLSADEPVESDALEDADEDDDETLRGPGGEEPPAAA